MMPRSYSAVVVACMLIGAPTAQEQPDQVSYRPRIAVNTLEGRGVSADEAATLTDVLRTELIGTGRIQMMERGQMESILREQGFQQSGACDDEACLVEMGRLLGIEQLVAGSIGKVGKAYSVSARMISVQTGEVLHTVSHNYTGPIEGLLTQEMKLVAKKLVGIEPKLAGDRRHRSKAPLIIGATGVGLAAAAGIAVFLARKPSDETNEPAEVLFQW